MTESPLDTPGEPAPVTVTGPVPVAFADPQYLAAVVDLLGVIAYGEMSAFERLAEDAKMAPGLEDKAELAKMATTEFSHFEGLRDRMTALGADPFAAMAPFVQPFDAFHTRTLIIESLADAGQSAFVVDRVRRAIAADHRVGGRLALWGRRLMGEALSQAQRVAAERDALSALLAGGVDRPGMDLAAIGRLFARLTENHAKRMEALGLSA